MTTEVRITEEKGCYRFDCFSGLPVTAAFSDRTYNLRFQEDLVSGPQDRQMFCEMLNLPAQDLVCPDQIHSANIVLVTPDLKGRGASQRDNAISRADGLLVKDKAIPIAVQTADCASIFLYDPKNHKAGVAHVGWRGLYGGLPAKMVSAFSNNLLSRPKDLIVAFGPMIRKCCYEIGEDVASFFDGHVADRKGKLFLDMAAAITSALLEMGVHKKHIEDLGFCTSCHNELFYSYRKEGDSTGRILSVIMLR